MDTKRREVGLGPGHLSRACAGTGRVGGLLHTGRAEKVICTLELVGRFQRRDLGSVQAREGVQVRSMFKERGRRVEERGKGQTRGYRVLPHGRQLSWMIVTGMFADKIKFR